MSARIFGSGIKRLEDPRLITGQAKYTDDFVLPSMAHLAVVRSPYAHAKIKAIRTKKAAAMEGVLGVFLGKDMKDAGFGGIPCAWVVPGSEAKTPPYLPIAIDTVRYAGNAVAIVVAADRYLARDAADAGRGRLRAAAGDRRRREGHAKRRAPAPRRGAGERRLPLEGLRRRRRRGLQGRRRGRQGADHQPASHPQRHGAARGTRAVPVGERRVHALGDQPEPPHRAVPAVPRHRDAGAQDPRHRAGGRRRLRQQDPPLPRRLDGRLRLDRRWARP